MNLTQTLRRFGQQSKSWGESYDELKYQLPLLKKLYAKNGLRLELTCGACPEQYDVFKDDRIVGYLRLRHGTFTVDYPNVSGVEIYSADPNGDGTFDADERLNYMAKAMRAILYQLK